MARIFINKTTGETLNCEPTIFHQDISISTEFLPNDALDNELLRQLDMGDITVVFSQAFNEDGWDIFFTADNTRFVLEVVDSSQRKDYYQITFSLYKDDK